MKKSRTSKERLRKRADLSKIFLSSNSVKCRGMKLLFKENNLNWNRSAVAPSRGFKRAVDRNREKRVCREIYRSVEKRNNIGYDLVFILYPGNYDFSERYKQVTSLLVQAGLI